MRKYDSIWFDYGGTLGRTILREAPDFLEMPSELHGLIKSLYHRDYRLGIISNANQYSDGHFMRKKLADYGLLHLFEATQWVYPPNPIKPDKVVFQRMLDFFMIEPSRVLMVGDSELCDGGCTELGIDFLHVKLNRQMWIEDLERKLT